MTVLVAVAANPYETQLVAALTAAPAAPESIRRCLDMVDLLGLAATGVGDVALISASLRRFDRDSVRQLHSAGVAVVALVTGDDAELHDRLTSIGVDAIIEPEPGVVMATVATLARHPIAAGPRAHERTGRPATEADPSSRAGSPATLVAVWGPAGAPGRTSVAVAVADALARRGDEVVLADADVYGPSVALLLGIVRDPHGLPALARSAATGAIGPVDVARCCVRLASGLKVLTGVASPRRWNDLRPAALEAVFDALRLRGGAVVVDCGPGLDDDGTGFLDVSVLHRDASTSVALRAADVVLVVGSADPLGLSRLVARLHEVRAVAPTADLRVVVTRVRKDVCGRSPERQVRQALVDHLSGVDPVLVPDDRPAFDAALLAGRTLAEVRPDSPALAVLDALAGSLRPGTPAVRARSSPRRRLIRSRHGNTIDATPEGTFDGASRARRRLGWRPHERTRRLDRRMGR